MVAAGLGADLLLANEVLDARRLGTLVAGGSRITLAVDSARTVAAAPDGGVPEVLIDVDVGLQRCGCAPADAGALADLARSMGLDVRGVMGYEGHVVGLEDARERAERCQDSMELLLAAHEDVRGSVISAGGTGTYDCNRWATEIQAGSYALMDVAYGRLGLPFRQALFVRRHRDLIEQRLVGGRRRVEGLRHGPRQSGSRGGARASLLGRARDLRSAASGG